MPRQRRIPDEEIWATNPVSRDQVRIVDRLWSMKVPFVIAGEVATNAYSKARGTRTLELIVPHGELSRLVEKLASITPGARVVRSRWARGKSYCGSDYRIMRGRRAIADLAPETLFPHYGHALAAPRRAKVVVFEGAGSRA